MTQPKTFEEWCNMVRLAASEEAIPEAPMKAQIDADLIASIARLLSTGWTPAEIADELRQIDADPDSVADAA